MTPQLPFKLMTVQELDRRQRAGEPFYLLDVRQPAEHALAALPGSKLIPLNQLLERIAEVEPPAGVPVVVYCHHGIRSQHGAMALVQHGLTEVYSLHGGIDAWSLEVGPNVPRY
jgi:rhodanese-related sulfurtransferase